MKNAARGRVVKWTDMKSLLDGRDWRMMVLSPLASGLLISYGSFCASPLRVLALLYVPVNGPAKGNRILCRRKSYGLFKCIGTVASWGQAFGFSGTTRVCTCLEHFGFGHLGNGISRWQIYGSFQRCEPGIAFGFERTHSCLRLFGVLQRSGGWKMRFYVGSGRLV